MSGLVVVLVLLTVLAMAVAHALLAVIAAHVDQPPTGSGLIALMR